MYALQTVVSCGRGPFPVSSGEFGTLLLLTFQRIFLLLALGYIKITWKVRSLHKNMFSR